MDGERKAREAAEKKLSALHGRVLAQARQRGRARDGPATGRERGQGRQDGSDGLQLPVGPLHRQRAGDQQRRPELAADPAGQGEGIFDRYKECVKPQGYRLKAMVVNFPRRRAGRHRLLPRTGRRRRCDRRSGPLGSIDKGTPCSRRRRNSSRQTFLALTVGIVVFFVGVLITQRVEFLRRYSIPEPVTGGFVAALVLWAVHALFGVDIGFDMTTRDKLLVIFFATVGVNARLAGSRGRRPGARHALPGDSRLRLPAGHGRHYRRGGIRPAEGGGSRRRLDVARRRARHGDRLGADHRRRARLSGGAGERHRRRDARPDHREPAGRSASRSS